MRTSSFFAPLAIATFSFPSNGIAQLAQLSFRCDFIETCSTLEQTFCWQRDDAFLLKFSSDNGFSAVLDGEIWQSAPAGSQYSRDDLTSLIIHAPSGETGLLSVNQSWEFSLTIHFTGPSDGIEWISSTGSCEDMS